MRALKVSVLLILLCVFSVGTIPAQAGEKVDLGQEVLAEGDGWGSVGPGVTGGSGAAPEQIYTVTNRQELVAA